MVKACALSIAGIVAFIAPFALAHAGGLSNPAGEALAARPLVFAATTTGDLEIFVAGDDGQNGRQLTENVGNDMHPDWSPTGERILYTSTRAGNSDLYEIDLATGEERRLTTSPEFDGYGVFSPDGALIAFASAEANGTAQLKVIDARTLETVATSQGFGEITAPKWSPDGRRIAYARPKEGDARKSAIAIFDLESGEETMASSGDGVDSSPAWSPDSTMIAFTSYRESRSRIYLAQLGAAGEAQISETDLQDVMPVFAGARRVAFACTDQSSGRKNVCLASLDGGSREVLVESGEEIVELSVGRDAGELVWIVADAGGFTAYRTLIADGSTAPILPKRKVLINASYAPSPATGVAAAGAGRTE